MKEDCPWPVEVCPTLFESTLLLKTDGELNRSLMIVKGVLTWIVALTFGAG
jgi:hypothetical protein